MSDDKKKLERFKKENPVAYLRERFYAIKNRPRTPSKKILGILEDYKSEEQAKDSEPTRKIAGPRLPESEV
jgi:hypothetical protein